jgi:4,5:9,10-diseco-3-hydroxy-5,9,17-trioxoandrosta-1(10),2-diene-4-oate hydrolase
LKRSAAFESLTKRIGVPVEKGNVSAGAIKTAYITAGMGQPVVLLHGSSAGGITWYGVIGPLSQHWRVIAPDVVGYGESDKPTAAYDRPYFAAWLRTFLDALDLPKVSLIGLSQGGAIALQFTLENPERVDRLVLADSAGLGKVTSLGGFLGLLCGNTLPSRVAGWCFNRYLVHHPRSIDPTWAEYKREVSRMPGGKRVFWQGRGKAVAPIPVEQLRQVTHRTLIVWGGEERFLPLSHAEAAQRVMPNARLQVIPKAGHITFFDQPEAFCDLIIQFLKEP